MAAAPRHRDTLRALRRADVASLRAALWTFRAARRARRRLRAGGVPAVSLPPVPGVDASARRGVYAVLRRGGYTCLEQALVRQAWDAAHGQPRELVIGVTSPSGGFGAHAWLEGDPARTVEEFVELLRHPAPAVR